MGHERASKDASGQSALHYALNGQHLKVAQILFKHPKCVAMKLDGMEGFDTDEIVQAAAAEGLPIDWVPQRNACLAELRFHEMRTAHLPRRGDHGPSRKYQQDTRFKWPSRNSTPEGKRFEARQTLLQKKEVMQGRVLVLPQQAG